MSGGRLERTIYRHDALEDRKGNIEATMMNKKLEGNADVRRHKV